MAYSTVTDLKNYLPESVLLQLTDDSNTDDIDSEKIDDCIRRADDLIDGYMRGRYTVPITGTVPVLIKDISTKLAVYFLHKRSLMLTLPDPIKDDYDYCMQQLSNIQKGRLSPFDVQTNPVWVVSNTSNMVPLTVQAMTSPGSSRPFDRFLI
jgi:phage gp36-like protein